MMYVWISIGVFAVCFALWFWREVRRGMVDPPPMDDVTKSYKREMEQRSEDEEEGK